jgi:hypothetical protein
MRRFLSSSAARSPSPVVASIRLADQFINRERARGLDPASVVIMTDVVTQDEHDALATECEASLRRRRYQHGHWDQVIEHYKEVEKLQWSDANSR